MEMRHDVAKAGEIDLVGPDGLAHGALDGCDDSEQMTMLDGTQVGHLRDVALPDDPAEAGKRNTLGAADADDAANLILPEEFSAG